MGFYRERIFNMLIREALIEDLPEMLEIYNEAVKKLTATFDLQPQTLEQRKSWFAQFGGKHTLLVAEIDGQVAGYCSLSKFRDKEAYAKTAELSVYLSEAFRGRGLGPVLIKEILDMAKQLQFHTIISGITTGNEVSVRIHERFGFEFIGTFKEVGFKFGEWQSVDF